MKENNLMVISTDAEKTPDRLQHLFMIENTSQTRNRKELHKHDKGDL